MKWLKWTFVGLLTLAVIVIGGAFAALQLMDIERIRSFLQTQIEANTGRSVTITGDVQPTLGFSPTLTIHDVTLSNPKWAASDHLIQASEIHVSLRLLPLFSDRISIKDVRILNADIHLEKSKKGTPSWNFKADAEKLKELEQQEESTLDLSIDRLSIQNSTVTYNDLGSKKTYRIGMNELRVEGIANNTVDTIVIDGTYKKAQLKATGSINESFIMLDAALNSPNANASAKGSIAQADFTFDMQISADAKKLSNLLTLFDVKSDNQAPLKITTDIGGKPDIITFSKLNASYDGYPVTGSGSINLTGAVPYIAAKLSSNEISFKNKKQPTLAADGSTVVVPTWFIPPTPIPTAGLDALNTDIELSIKKILLDKLTLENATATVKLKDGKLSINPLLVHNTSSGWVKGYVIIYSAQTPPVLSVDLITNDVDLGRVLAEMEGSTSLKGGITKSHIKLKGPGKNLKDVMANANGQLNFFIDEAVYASPPRLARAASFIELLRGGNSGNINVNCLVGRFTVKNGIASSEAVALKTGGAIVTGNGSVNLGQETIDMRFRARSTSLGLADLVPAMRFDGPLVNPNIYPDPGSTLWGIGKYVLGAATGVGLVAILGEKATDTLGITADNNPCLQSIVEIEQKADARDPDETLNEISKTAGKLEDNVKQNIKDIEDQTKGLRDGVRGMLKE